MAELDLIRLALARIEAQLDAHIGEHRRAERRRGSWPSWIAAGSALISGAVALYAVTHGR
jgi:hypothetical protein